METNIPMSPSLMNLLNTANALNSNSSQLPIYTVSELNSAAQKVLEGHFQKICVEGEISNLVRPASGHLYFTLKDPKAQVRAAMFKSQQRQLIELRNGLMVQVKARVSIYPDRGDYQLIVESVELAGEGLLRQAYEKLLAKLKAEGLFDESFKKPFPKNPMHIAVVTSATGAAIRDILSVLKRRAPNILVTLIPTKVQGLDAAPEIVRALWLANHPDEWPGSKNCHPIDAIILARGGGSLEDLWPFNEELVARAIFSSKLPIITGVGHEIDFTIADFVADRRAPTPSAAAELLSPNMIEILQKCMAAELYFKQMIMKTLEYHEQKLDYLMKRLRHPNQAIQQQLIQLKKLTNRLFTAVQFGMERKKQFYIGLARALNAVSPLSTLGRGYAIAIHHKTGNIIRSVTEVSPGDLLKIQLADGELEGIKI